MVPDGRNWCGAAGRQAGDVAGVCLAGGGEVFSKVCDQAVLFGEASLKGGVLGGQAVMIELQLGVGVWIDCAGSQLGTEVQLALTA
jgi:hypothetical protein